MNLFVAGINHKTAPVEVRERLSFSAQEVIEAGRQLREKFFFQEALVLSTCNRVEIYAVAASSQNDYAGVVKKFLSQFHGIEASDFESRIYIHKDEEAVKHLFRVTSGLDSMVIGEVEILGQVKKAYKDAQAAKSTGKIINRLMEKAFNTAKKVRTETFIARGLVSVSSVAVRLAEKILGSLSGKEALIIGAGQIGEQLLMYLKKNGVKTIIVANRTYEKAVALAEKFSATATKFEDFPQKLIGADIVISSTGAPHAIIRKDDISRLMRERRQRPLFLIDLAVPRDIEAEVNKIDNAYLYNIDDLQKIVDGNIALRKNELEHCEKFIDNASRMYMQWLSDEEKRAN